MWGAFHPRTQMLSPPGPHLSLKPLRDPSRHTWNKIPPLRCVLHDRPRSSPASLSPAPPGSAPFIHTGLLCVPQMVQARTLLQGFHVLSLCLEFPLPQSADVLLLLLTAVSPRMPPLPWNFPGFPSLLVPFPRLVFFLGVSTRHIPPSLPP